MAKNPASHEKSERKTLSISNKALFKEGFRFILIHMNILKNALFLIFFFYSSLLLASTHEAMAIDSPDNNDLQLLATSLGTTPQAINQSGNTAKKRQVVSLQLQWHHQFQFAGYYAAIKEGYYKEVGLKLALHDWYPHVDLVKVAQTGEADFSISYDNALIKYLQKGDITAVMAAFQHSPLVFISKTPIDSLSDLLGKRIYLSDNVDLSALIEKAPKEVVDSLSKSPSSGDLTDFEEGRIDIYTASQTNEIFQLREKNIPFYILDPKLFGVQSYGDLVITSNKFANLNPTLVQNFKEASIKGWQYALGHKEEMVDYIMAHYPVVKSRESLLSEAQATESYVRSGSIPVGDLDPTRLASIANSAVRAGLLDTKPNNFAISSFIFNPYDLPFTAEERQYLLSHPDIKLANDIDWAPFEWVDSKGQYKGLVSDYLEIISQKTGLRFHPVKDLHWDQMLKGLKSGKFDMLSCAVKTKERQTYLDFTQPFISVPMVMVSKIGTPLVDDFSYYNGQTVAVVEGYWSQEYLQKNYPKVLLLLVKNAEEGLRLVSQGKAAGYLGNLVVVNYLIQKEGLSNLSVVAELHGKSSDLSMAVPKNNPILLSILNKTLASISDKQHAQLLQKWLPVDAVKRVDDRVIYDIFGYFFAVILLFVAVLLFYRHQYKRRQKYLDQIHELTYATEFDPKKGLYSWVSDTYAELSGYSKEELYALPVEKLLGSKADLDKLLFAIQSKGSWAGLVRAFKKDGSYYWVEASYRLFKPNIFSSPKIWTTRVDVTDKMKLEMLSNTDALTGLYNRRYYNELLSEGLKSDYAEQRDVYALLLDIDWFKSVNDHFGHQQGDETLIKVSDRIQSFFMREFDYVFRMGGEEFFVYSRCDGKEIFEKRVKSICQAIEDLHLPTGMEGENKISDYVTISVGAVYWAYPNIIDADKLYALADKALYQAKHNGRNQVVFL